MNTVSCNAAVSDCKKGSVWTQAALAMDLLLLMVISSVQMNSSTCGAAASSCEKGDACIQALVLFSLTSRNQSPVEYRHVQCCSQCLRKEAVSGLRPWNSMARRIVQMNAITCTAPVSACAKRGVWTHASEFSSSTTRSMIQTNTVSCNAAVSDCEKGGEWTQAMWF